MSEQDGGTTTTAEAGAGQEQGKEPEAKKEAPAKGKTEQPGVDEIAKEFGLRDVDVDDPKDKMFVGIITKLRGKNRDLAAQLEAHGSELTEAREKLAGYERKDREGALMAEVLGEKLVLGDEAKFRKWAAKLSSGETWEADFKELVKDFAVEKPGAADKPEPGKGEQGGEAKPTPYVPRILRGKDAPSKAEPRTATPPAGPMTPLQRLAMKEQDPEGYEALRGRRRFRS